MRFLKIFLSFLFFVGLPATAWADNSWSFYLGGGSGSYNSKVGQNPLSLFAISYLQEQPGYTYDPSKNVIQLFTLKEAAGQLTFRTKEDHYKLGFEKLFGESKIFGINFGVSGAGARVSCKENCGQYAVLSYVDYLSQTGQLDKIPTLSLAQLYSISQSQSYSIKYNYYTGDLGFTIHINGKGVVDPYFGADASYGRCSITESSSNSSCVVYRTIGKGGIRFNIGESFYLFAQGEGHNLRFQLKTGEAQLGRLKTYDRVTVGGLGIRF